MSNVLLYVDDSATMQQVAEFTFFGSDWEYVGARTADEGRSTASAKSPSYIIVDAVMPDGSGYDLAKELKAAHPSATVVMACGNSEAYDSAKGSAAGCAGGIVKPWQTDKIVVQLKELSDGDASSSAASPASPEASTPSAGTPIAAIPMVKKRVEVGPPRSATLMGMPALEMPPSKPLPAGVASIKSGILGKSGIPGIGSKPAIPTPAPPTLRSPVRTPAPPIPTPAPPAPVAAKPQAKTPVPAPAPAPAPGPAASSAREPMIKGTPGKPIRLVLASQAIAAANQAGNAGGLSDTQASALSDVSRELLEQIIWEVVPDLAEAIIRENLETLAAK